MTLIIPLLFTLLSAQAGDFDSRQCSTNDLQACRTCDAITKATEKHDPNDGEYLHAAQWNGLYAAYVHGCMSTAENLLKRGANPNWGGALGSMLISVSNKWPHNDKTINQKWAALLLKYGASKKQIVPIENKTPTELLEEYERMPEYPDIWAIF